VCIWPVLSQSMNDNSTEETFCAVHDEGAKSVPKGAIPISFPDSRDMGHIIARSHLQSNAVAAKYGRNTSGSRRTRVVTVTAELAYAKRRQGGPFAIGWPLMLC